MSGSVKRSLRFIDAGERRQRPIDYWRDCSFGDRLQAVLALHHQGNALFKGGKLPFAYQWKLIDVRAG